MPNIVCREIDSRASQRSRDPVSIYQPLGESLTQSEQAELNRYHAALSLYRERKLTRPASFTSLAEGGEFTLYAIYAQRSSAYSREARRRLGRRNHVRDK